MAHNLAVSNGKTAMAYTGETPWHGLGTRVEHAMTSAEAIKAAGLDWSVEKKEIMFQNQASFVRVEDRFATVRMDTQEALGVVGRVYRPLQNRDAFSFFDAIVGEKLAMYHTAGALGKGERVWLSAQLPGDLWITPQDNIKKFLLLSNSHDGFSSVEIMVTPIRVVCQNTLNAALTCIGSEKNRTKVRHTVNMGAGIDEIRHQLGIVDVYFKRFEEMGKHLVSKKATAAIVEQLFTDLGLSEAKAKESTRTENIRFDILKLFEKGKGNDDLAVRGSAWALFNGVTEYVDHQRSARGEGNEKLESRATSLLFGSGAMIKQKALDSLLVAVK